MAKTESSSESTPTPAPRSEGLRFKVVKGSYGPYPLGTVFGESHFRSIHPTNAIAEKDRDAYHDGLLDLAVRRGVIVPTQDKITSLEPSPGNPLASDTLDSLRKASEEADATKAAQQQMQENDLAARNTDADKK